MLVSDAQMIPSWTLMALTSVPWIPPVGVGIPWHAKMLHTEFDKDHGVIINQPKPVKMKCNRRRRISKNIYLKEGREKRKLDWLNLMGGRWQDKHT